MRVKPGTLIGAVSSGLITASHVAITLMIMRIASEETWDGSNGISVTVLVFFGAFLFGIQIPISIAMFFANRSTDRMLAIYVQAPMLVSLSTAAMLVIRPLVT